MPNIYWPVLVALLLLYTNVLAQTNEELSETQTTYAGAILLQGQANINYERLEPGIYHDNEARDRYSFWQGDSLFTGVVDELNGNRVDAVMEFYWFESSINRSSDFYVVVLKVASAPAPSTNWRINTSPTLGDELLFRDIVPAQSVNVRVDESGIFGALRWDWSNPFGNYRWEPSRVIEVSQEYTAGVNVEGSAMRSVTEGVNIQAKGFANANTKVTTKYTITLYRWEMRTQGGGTYISWNLVALDPEHDVDPAYHEYFAVIQAPRGNEVRIEEFGFAAGFRERRGGLLDDLIPDAFENVSVKVSDITLHPPELNHCPEGEVLIDDACFIDCPETHALIEGECVLICPDGFMPSGDECKRVCADGYRVTNGNNCETICDYDEVFENGACIDICENGTEFVGGECVVICEENEVLENGQCNVPSPPDAASPRPVPVTCGEGTYLRNGQCVPYTHQPTGLSTISDAGTSTTQAVAEYQGGCQSTPAVSLGSELKILLATMAILLLLAITRPIY